MLSQNFQQFLHFKQHSYVICTFYFASTCENLDRGQEKCACMEGREQTQVKNHGIINSLHWTRNLKDGEKGGNTEMEVSDSETFPKIGSSGGSSIWPSKGGFL